MFALLLLLFGGVAVVAASSGKKPKALPPPPDVPPFGATPYGGIVPPPTDSVVDYGPLDLTGTSGAKPGKSPGFYVRGSGPKSETMAEKIARIGLSNPPPKRPARLAPNQTDYRAINAYNAQISEYKLEYAEWLSAIRELSGRAATTLPPPEPPDRLDYGADISYQADAAAWSAEYADGQTNWPQRSQFGATPEAPNALPAAGWLAYDLNMAVWKMAHVAWYK